MKLKDITTEDVTQYVGLLTLEQKDQLIKQTYADDEYFNPIQDMHNNWIISTQEMIYCVNPNFLWVKDLPIIIYDPKIPISGSTI